MRALERSAALAMLALAFVVGLGSRELTFWDGFSPGDRFMPLIIACVTAILALLYFREAGRRLPDEPAPWPKGGSATRVSAIAIAIIGFAVAAPWLGFVTATAAFVGVVLVAVLKRPVLPSLLAVAITTLIVHGVFVAWLGIRLPTGIVGI